MAGSETLHEAYVLHLRPWRETSALVELFAREQGRVGAVARGVRGGRGRGSGALQPFRVLMTAWHGRGELRTLGRVELARDHALRGEALYAGLYLNELLVRLLHRDDGHPGLWDAYARTLAALQQGAALQPILRAFELTLLAELGYGVDLERDVDGRPLDDGCVYRFDPETGLIRERGEGVAEMDGLAPLRLRGDLLRALAAGRLERPGVAGAAKALTRRALAPHLGPRPLRSRELFRRRR